MFSVNLQKAITCKLYIFDINFLQIKKTNTERQTNYIMDAGLNGWLSIILTEWLLNLHSDWLAWVENILILETFINL